MEDKLQDLMFNDVVDGRKDYQNISVLQKRAREIYCHFAVLVAADPRMTPADLPDEPTLKRRISEVRSFWPNLDEIETNLMYVLQLPRTMQQRNPGQSVFAAMPNLHINTCTELREEDMATSATSLNPVAWHVQQLAGMAKLSRETSEHLLGSCSNSGLQGVDAMVKNFFVGFAGDDMLPLRNGGNAQDNTRHRLDQNIVMPEYLPRLNNEARVTTLQSSFLEMWVAAYFHPSESVREVCLGAIDLNFGKKKQLMDAFADALDRNTGESNALDEALRPLGLVYPVYPGEYSASIGGNVATNAGGMRAVKYGVTRHQVLGLEVVLPGGETLRTGGRYVKSTTGYDLTQLIIGSEGTLALVTEVIIKLYPRPEHQATVLAPFSTLDEVTAAVPRIVDSGIGPLVLEYIDLLTMSATASYSGLELGIPQEIKDSALAYLVVVLENAHEERLEEDLGALAGQLAELGALDVFVLPPAAAGDLIAAREQAFWMAKANGADDIVDVVVPRAQIPVFMNRVSELAAEYDAWIAGCGHAGDGNVHLGVFCADDERRGRLLHELFASGMQLGGAISAEHGIGGAKKEHFLELEDPAKIALLHRTGKSSRLHGLCPMA